jgi:hypothetical protein
VSSALVTATSSVTRRSELLEATSAAGEKKSVKQARSTPLTRLQALHLPLVDGSACMFPSCHTGCHEDTAYGTSRRLASCWT